jgi:LPS export ABC transporter permease LptG/LPS export ABC transporter permease LptF
MLRTIDRYVIREVIPPFFLSLVIFTFLLEIPPVMRDLETLVAKGVPWQVAGQIILTLIPQALGLTIPMALLTGLLIGLGRLSADREAVALLACGVSPYRLLRPVMFLALLAAGATQYVMLEGIPQSNQKFREITFDLITKKVENDIRPRVFFEDFPGWVLYVRDVPATGGGWADVMVANTSRPGATELYLAERGRLVLSREERRVDLILSNGTRYSTGKPGETQTTTWTKDLTMALNPDDVFSRGAPPPGITEKSIAELRKDGETKLRAGFSPHPEIYYIQQKFSIPVACFVFALIGLALGLTVSRDGKLGGFVIGVVVIFAYYVVMFLAEAQTKGHYRTLEEAGQLASSSFLNARLTRWWPNIAFGCFGIAALIWRARFSERQFPIGLSFGVPHLPARWSRSAAPAAAADPAPVGAAPPGQPAGAASRKVVVVLRVPRLRMPGPGVLDRYVSRLYLRVVGLSFLALLGLFYISTFIDASDKIFKGSASTGMVMQLLAYRTPQFVYFVIPIAALLSVLVTFGLLSRTSELTVMKACGISLYRAAAPVVLLSLVFSALLFALDQEILARANRRAGALDDEIRGRPPKTFNPLNRRWIIGEHGIYHYGAFDEKGPTLSALNLYRLAPGAWRLASQTYVSRADYKGGWTGRDGWTQEFSGGRTWRAFGEAPLAIEPPDYFETEETETDVMTVLQLRKAIGEARAGGFNFVPQEVELHRKMAFPFVTLVMTLLAIPFGVTTGRRGALYGIGLGIIIALSYSVTMNVFIALGKTGLLPPILAAWTPNVIVAAIAAYLFLRART